MNQMLINLNKILKNNPLISSISEHYDYIKIDTACPIKYSNEFLTLYAKIIENNILITDLNLTPEDAYNCKISDKTLIACIEKNHLNFDGTSIFSIVPLEQLGEVIENFTNLVRDLKI